MKTTSIISAIFILILISSLGISAQTLYNGVGHIPFSHRVNWDDAGLLQNMSSVVPKLVIPITPGAASSTSFQSL
jgi:hypothetical protein